MKNKYKKYLKNNILIISFAVIIALTLSGCGTTVPNYKVDLEIWGLFDDSDVFVKAIQEYKRRNARVGTITYKKMTVDSYENDLRDALATGKGPDIFLIHHTWLAKHLDKLQPAPAEMMSSSGKNAAFITPRSVEDNFPDVVQKDFVSGTNVYALPLTVDSLALYYNKDLLNQAGISRPPKTWEEFDSDVQKMTKIDSFGNITLSGAAMGASSDRPENPGGGKINRATDILTLLMMQAGAEIYDPDKKIAQFAEFPDSFSGKDKTPGEMALEYYTKFSNLNSAQYSWNAKMHNSIDAFIEGKTAMTINYSWLIPRIEDKAPKLNFGIALVPQNKDQNGQGLNIDFANYWGWSVSKNKLMNAESGQKVTATNEQRIAEAWRFLAYLTMGSDDIAPFLGAVPSESVDYNPAADYAEKQKKPAARRDLIEKQKDDLLLSPFAQGNLIARSWPEPDNLAVEKIFDEMIDDVTLRNEKPDEVIRQAQNSVNLLIKR
ncbi:MAG: extracellular solute-binding protein [Candidatus Moranbacteria bacterium]|nr:extracellular solute-binding protein [Candidatus Moranbacteria bacterium]